MKHIYINNNSDYTLIMLHGTGGNEVEMADFGKRINSNFNILSILGNINEGGMNRFFKRFGVGDYDIDNYLVEIKNLKDAIIESSFNYNFDLSKTFVIGFSNGANIALGLLQEYPETLNNYILLSPDYINKDKGFKDLTNKEVLMSSSKFDQYTSYDVIIHLEETLKDVGAKVINFDVPGHTINMELFKEVQNFIQEKSGL